MAAITPVHPKEFRKLTGMSIEQISIKSGIPTETLKNWFAKDGSKRKSEPPAYVSNYFGYLINDVPTKQC